MWNVSGLYGFAADISMGYLTSKITDKHVELSFEPG